MAKKKEIIPDELNDEEINEILEDSVIRVQAYRPIEAEAKREIKTPRDVIVEFGEKKLRDRGRKKGRIRKRAGKVLFAYQKNLAPEVDIDQAYNLGILTENDVKKYSLYRSFGKTRSKLLLALIRRRINRKYKDNPEEKEHVYEEVIAHKPSTDIDILSGIPEDRELIVAPKQEYERLKSFETQLSTYQELVRAIKKTAAELPDYFMKKPGE